MNYSGPGMLAAIRKSRLTAKLWRQVMHMGVKVRLGPQVRWLLLHCLKPPESQQRIQDRYQVPAMHRGSTDLEADQHQHGALSLIVFTEQAVPLSTECQTALAVLNCWDLGDMPHASQQKTATQTADNSDWWHDRLHLKREWRFKAKCI